MIRSFRPIALAEPTVDEVELRRQHEREYQRQRRRALGATERDDPWVDTCPRCKTKTWDIGTFRDADGDPYLARFCVECLRRRSRPCEWCGGKVDSTHAGKRFCRQTCIDASHRHRNRVRMREARAAS